MVDVPEHLAPRDGLTDCHMRFAGLEAVEKGAARLSFELSNSKQVIGTMQFQVGPQAEGTVDAQIAAGFHVMRDVLRQWLWEADEKYKVFKARAPAAVTGEGS